MAEEGNNKAHNQEEAAFEQRVAPQVPHLKSHCDTLLELVSNLLEPLIAKNEDDLGVMSICFLNKQIEHLQAILRLEGHRDSELIARSMLEGLIQFIWAHNEKARPRLWREFGHIVNFRLINKDKSLGKNLDSNFIDRNREALDSLPKHFLNKRAEKAISKQKTLPEDPYIHNWHGKTVSALFEITALPEGPSLYGYYSRFSEWHHWDFAGFSRALDINEKGEIAYRSQSYLATAQALVVGFQCVWQTAELVADHFSNSDVSERLIKLKEAYLSYHGERK